MLLSNDNTYWQCQYDLAETWHKWFRSFLSTQQHFKVKVAFMEMHMLYWYATLTFLFMMRTCLPPLLNSSHDDFYFTFFLHFVAVDNNENFPNFIQVITPNDHCKVFIFIIVGYLWLCYSVVAFFFISLLQPFSILISLSPSLLISSISVALFSYPLSPSPPIIPSARYIFSSCNIRNKFSLALANVRTANVIKEISRAVIRRKAQIKTTLHKSYIALSTML